jgi:hypothetical protein
MEGVFSPNVEVSLFPGFKIPERTLLFDRLPDFGRLSCESSAKAKMSVEQGCNDAYREDRITGRKQCHFEYHTSHTD